MLPKRILQAIKAGDVRVFYKWKVWRKKRLVILQRDNFECQRCKVEGKFSKATTVHHIKPLREYPELALEEDNLSSRCDPCHNKEHPEKLKKYQAGEGKEPITPERW